MGLNVKTLFKLCKENHKPIKHIDEMLKFMKIAENLRRRWKISAVGCKERWERRGYNVYNIR